MILFANVTSSARDLIAAHATFAGESVLLGAVLILVATATVARSSNVATIVTGAPHRLITGAKVQVTGISQANFNTAEATVTVTSATAFTYPNDGTNLGTTSQTAGIIRANEDQVTEIALRDNGHAVTIFPILDAETIGRAPGKTMLDVGVGVRIETNPERATKNVHTLIKDAIAALTVRTTEPNDAFKIADKALEVDPSDPGLLSYILYFQKQAQL